MPARKLPEDKVLWELVDQGMSNIEIAEWVRVHRGTVVTADAIGMWRKRQDAPRQKPKPRVMPWSPMRAAHRYTSIAQAVRLWYKREAGFELNRDQLVKVTNFEKDLKARGLVVAYVYESPDGFYLVPRRDGVDLGIIHELDDKPHPPQRSPVFAV